MMRFLTLEAIKKHGRIEGSLEDELLLEYGEAAEDTVLNLLNRTYDNLIGKYGQVPKPVYVACLALSVHWYNHRDLVSSQNLSDVPYSIDAMVRPYIVL